MLISITPWTCLCPMEIVSSDATTQGCPCFSKYKKGKGKKTNTGWALSDTYMLIHSINVCGASATCLSM